MYICLLDSSLVEVAVSCQRLSNLKCVSCKTRCKGSTYLGNDKTFIDFL